MGVAAVMRQPRRSNSRSCFGSSTVEPIDAQALVRLGKVVRAAGKKTGHGRSSLHHLRPNASASTMDRPYLIDRLARHRDVFNAMFTGLTPEEIRWKPAPEKWCALEIICHLHDEEREDFRARLSSTLAAPEEPWPKIDPQAWITERRYMEQDFAAVLGKFLRERDKSVQWLRGLSGAPWGNAYVHPKVGPVSCELLLTNWVAHDLHHIRQLNKLRYEYLKSISTVPLDYAGTW